MTATPLDAMRNSETREYRLPVTDSWLKKLLNGKRGTHHIAVDEDLAEVLGWTPGGKKLYVGIYVDDRLVSTGTLNPDTCYLTGVKRVFDALQVTLEDAGRAVLLATPVRGEDGEPGLRLRRALPSAPTVPASGMLQPITPTFLDAQSEHTSEDMTRVPSSQEYAAALGALGNRFSDLQRYLLRAHYWAPGRTATTTELAALARIEGGHPAVNLHYGNLCAVLCEYLHLDPGKRADGTPRWWRACSTGWTTDAGFVWRMRDEVARALETVAWTPPVPALPGEEDLTEGAFLEGTAHSILRNAYERDPLARQACIEIHGLRCAACDFNFASTYGEIGAGYVEVHHRVPLSTVAGTYRVDPAKDLVPLCANCHSMVHRRTPPYDVEELRQAIASARASR